MTNVDVFGNSLATNLPYARGEVIRSTEDDVRKLSAAWKIIRQRAGGSLPTYNLSGLERGIDFYDGSLPLDDELAPALTAARLREVGLEHLGGDEKQHDVVLLNRLTAALFVAAQVVVPRESTVVALTPSYSHPAVRRAVAFRDCNFVDTDNLDDFARQVSTARNLGAVVLTRLAVTYEVLAEDVLSSAVALAKERNVPVILDDAGGARVGPAVFGQSRSLALGVDVAATGLDKYGTLGPRLGLLGAKHDVASMIRARAFELGMEARPMLYPAVVQSLESYTDEKVRELVLNTKALAKELHEIAPAYTRETEVIVYLPGELLLKNCLPALELNAPPVVPYESTAALAMLLLRDHGILTVHFAGLPPGTSSLLFKFIPTDVLDEFGGPRKLAEAIADGIHKLPSVISDVEGLKQLLYE